MADPPLPDESTGTPRWVKIFAIVAALVVLLVVVLLVFGGGKHGPSRHAPGSATTATTGGHTGPPTGVTHGE
jgi:hypothetical protein